MNLPKRVIGILGVIHVLLITYAILTLLVFVNLATTPWLAGSFVTGLRRFGFLLYLIPLGWTIGCACAQRSAATRNFATGVALVIWMVITVALLALAVDLSVAAALP